MALSEHEKQLLAEMERGLYASEADSLKTRSGVRKRPSYRATVIASLGVIVGIGLLVGAVSTGFLWLGILAFLIMLGAILFAFSPKNQVSVTGVGGKEGPSETLAQKAERRWEERMDGER